MSNFREKSQVFIMGMVAGLLIAGGFFILKLDDYFKELNLYKNVVKTFYLNSKSSEFAIKQDEVAGTEDEKSSKGSTKKRYRGNVDSSTINYQKALAAITADTMNMDLTNDSSYTSNGNSEDIVVRKDELLSYKTTEVINLSQVASNTNHSDSLLQQVSGIRDDKNVAKQFFNIELWQSPLNYRGYKMSKYKIVLYGIVSAEALKIYKLDDDIYLKTGSTVYKLEQSDDFRPYQYVAEQTVISKLK